MKDLANEQNFISTVAPAAKAVCQRTSAFMCAFRSTGLSPSKSMQIAGSAGSRVASWKRIQTLTGEATRPLDDRCQLEVIMRGGHCLKVWTKKQQVVSLSSAESELYAAVKTATEGLGI